MLTFLRVDNLRHGTVVSAVTLLSTVGACLFIVWPKQTATACATAVDDVVDTIAMVTRGLAVIIATGAHALGDALTAIAATQLESWQLGVRLGLAAVAAVAALLALIL